MGLSTLNLMPGSRVWDDVPALPRRERLWIEEGKKCHWCGRPTRFVAGDPPDQATIDHVIPRYKGGTSEEENLVSACRACNARRNSEDLKGLKEGALMGDGHSSKRVALSGDEKRALMARLATVPTRMKKEDVILAQRDQALKTIEDLREKLKQAEVAIEARERKLKTMTVWQVIRRDLREFLRELLKED